MEPRRPDRSRDRRHGSDDYRLVGRAKARPLPGAILRAEMQVSATDVLIGQSTIALRTASCVIAASTMMAAASMMTVQAADEPLTLACQGTVTEDAKPEPISMGIIANFTNRTLQGVEVDLPVKIAGVNVVTVSF